MPVPKKLLFQTLESINEKLEELNQINAKQCEDISKDATGLASTIAKKFITQFSDNFPEQVIQDFLNQRAIFAL